MLARVRRRRGTIVALASVLVVAARNGCSFSPSAGHTRGCISVPRKSFAHIADHNDHRSGPFPWSTDTKITEVSTKTTAKKNEVEKAGLASELASVFHVTHPLDQPTKDHIKDLVKALKSYIFDFLFDGAIDRDFARFYALETIARMPYLSYLSVLHLFETLGQWRRADLLKVHFAEEWNELHHLLIMEELGGSEKWFDRFVAQHISFFYYFIIVAMYLFNPTMAYKLNQDVEEEAYTTYNNFLQTHEAYLKTQPAPVVAKKYYSREETYMFDSMHTGGGASELEPIKRRRPVVKTLYDTFVAIRDDEWEHARTMAHLQYQENEK